MRAETRVGARAVPREEVTAELLVERLDDLLDLEVLRVVDGGREVAPEIAQQCLPIDAPARHLIELVFEIGGEIVLDIALEEARQESGDETAAVFRDEAAFV